MLIDIRVDAHAHAFTRKKMSKRQVDVGSWFCAADALPMDVWIYILTFMGVITTSFEEFKHLWICTRLLYPEQSMFMDDVVPHLIGLPGDCVASNKLLVRCQSLRSLSLENTNNRDTIECIQGMLNLGSLNLISGTMELNHLVCLPKLTHLSVRHNYEGASAEGLQQLTGLTSLTILPTERKCSPDVRLYDDGIAGLTNLCKLDCVGTISDKVLRGLVGLHTLALKASAVTGESLSSLSCLTNLTLFACPFISTTVIGSLTALHRLSLTHYHRYPNFVLDELASLRNLQFIAFRSRHTELIQNFVSLNWPNGIESHIYAIKPVNEGEKK